MLDVSFHAALKNDLMDRRARLRAGLAQVREAEDLARLLDEVDHALLRLDARGAPDCEV